jgi:hypothetical protein
VHQPTLRVTLTAVALAGLLASAAHGWKAARIVGRIDNAAELLRGCEERRALAEQRRLQADAWASYQEAQGAATVGDPVPGGAAGPAVEPEPIRPLPACELASIDDRLRRGTPAVWAMQAVPDGTVLLATVNLPFPGLMVSTDAGDTWHYRHLFVRGYNQDRPVMLRGIAYRDGLLAVASDAGILLSRDSGHTFRTALEGHSFSAVAISPQCERVIVAGGDGTSVVSTDGGETWSELGFTDFVRELDTSNRHLIDHITSLEFDPAQPDTVYVGTGSHLYRLVLDGSRARRWQAMEGTRAGRVLDDSTVYNIAIGSRFMISTCNGVYWLERLEDDLAEDQAEVVWRKFKDKAFTGRGVGGPKGNLRSYFVSEDPGDPGRILVADFAGLYEGRSAEGGVRWRRVEDLPYYSPDAGYPEYTAITWTRAGEAVVGSRWGGIFVQDRPEAPGARGGAGTSCFLR